MRRMQYKIVGDVMQALQLELHQGEQVFAEAGTMLYMGPGIELQARMQGGLMKGLMRKFLAGESMFMSIFQCNAASGHMALANPIAGKIYPIELKGNTILAERNAYLCAIGNVDLSIAFTKRFGAGLFGGEGLFFATLTGPGHVVLQTLPFSRLANRLAAAAGTNKEESKGIAGIAGDVLGGIISGDD